MADIVRRLLRGESSGGVGTLTINRRWFKNENENPKIGVIVWRFEDNLTDYQGNLTWSNPQGSLSYEMSNLGKQLRVDAVEDTPNLRINDPGETFLFSWDTPFCVHFWHSRTVQTSRGVYIQLRDNSTSTNKNTDIIWAISPFSNALYFQIGVNSSDAIESKNWSFTVNQTSNNFYYVRYDPSDRKRIHIGINGEPEISLVFTSEWYFTSYDANYSLVVLPIRDTGEVNMTLNELSFWHTDVKTRRDLLDLYSDGKGKTVEEHLNPQGNYITWSFNSGLTSDKYGLRWTNVFNVPIIYGTGKEGTGLQWAATGDEVQFRIGDPREEFILDWSKPFVIGCWLKTSNNLNKGVQITLRDNSTSTAKANDRVWVFNIHTETNGNQTIGFQVAYDSSNTIENQQYTTTSAISSNVYHYYYVRYNPAIQKRVYVSIDGSEEQELVFSNDFYFNTYSSEYSLTITTSNGSLLSVGLDNLTFWHTEVVTRQQILEAAGNEFPSSEDPTNSYKDVVLTDLPLLYYTFSETSGTVLSDETTNAKNSTITKDLASFGSLFPNTMGARTFDGTAQTYTNNTVLARGYNYSVELVFLTTIPNVGLFSFGNSQVVGSESYWDKEAWLDNSGHLVFYGFDNGGWNATYATNLADGNPHHIVYTHANVDLKLYVDGVQRTMTGIVNRNSYAGYSSNLAYLRIGRSKQVTQRFMNGIFDEFVYYDKVLTQQQVADHYSALNLQ